MGFFSLDLYRLQIYNEDLLDLLCLPSQRQPLSIREELNGEIRVHVLFTVYLILVECSVVTCNMHGVQIFMVYKHAWLLH